MSFLHQLTHGKPEMIESFGVEKKEVAKWAGITSAVFSLSQCTTAIVWGRASDKFGRKPTILAGLTLTMVSCLLWGMSTSLPMAILARAFAGGCNGNGMLMQLIESQSNIFSWNHQNNGSRNGTRERAPAASLLNHASSLDFRFYLWTIIRRVLCEASREHPSIVWTQQISDCISICFTKHRCQCTIHDWNHHGHLVLEGQLQRAESKRLAHRIRKHLRRGNIVKTTVLHLANASRPSLRPSSASILNQNHSVDCQEHMMKHRPLFFAPPHRQDQTVPLTTMPSPKRTPSPRFHDRP